MGLITYGKISKTHGLSGEIKLVPLSRDLDNVSTLNRIFLKKSENQPLLEFKITSRRFHKNTAIIKLDGINSFDDAENIVGQAVYVDTDDLQDPDEDEYYWFQLVGLEAFLEDGTYLGKVESLIDRAFQSLIVIKKEQKEILIPFTDPIVKEVNLEESKIIISPTKNSPIYFKCYGMAPAY